MLPEELEGAAEMLLRHGFEELDGQLPEALDRDCLRAEVDHRLNQRYKFCLGFY